MARPPSEIAYPTRSDLPIDERLVTLTIEISGKTQTFNNLYISAVGVKYANPLQNEAEITIYNLDKDTQNYILTETSPYNANFSSKTATLEAGRQSYGTTVIFKGNIIYSSITQPPDLGVTLKCLTGNFLKSNIFSRTQPGTASQKQIAQAIAENTNTILLYQATDKEISNYSYTGSALQEIEYLAALGLLNVYIDDDTLVVKNAGEPLRGRIKDVSASTGMIGIPEFTERGVRVKFFIDNKTAIGGGIRLQSDIYPSVNGVYVIYQLAFQVTNRMVPFYYIADCFRIGQLSEVETSG